MSKISMKDDLRGMEHLMASNAENPTHDHLKEQEKEYKYLRGDLILVLVLILVFASILIGLQFVESRTSFLDVLSTSFFNIISS